MVKSPEIKKIQAFSKRYFNTVMLCHVNVIIVTPRVVQPVNNGYTVHTLTLTLALTYTRTHAHTHQQYIHHFLLNMFFPSHII